MNGHHLDLIVARYKEDVAWIKAVPPGVRVLLYDKGGSGLGTPLPNVGREAHTYLYAILEHWNDLAPTIAFVQGDPFFHTADLLLRLERILIDPPNAYAPMSWEIECDPEGRPHHLEQKGELLRCREIWEDLTGAACPEKLLFTTGAQFAVPRYIIKARPKAVYVRAMQWTDKSRTFAWEMERLWPYLFGRDGRVTVGMTLGRLAARFA
jgi:hypothetical protein